MANELLDHVRVLLEGAGLGLTFGTNLFAGTMPNSPNALVAIYEPPGAGPLEVMGGGLPPVERPQLQVQVRTDPYEYVTGRTLIWAIWKVLDAVTEQTIDGRRFLRIQAVTSPGFLTRDEEERVLFVANFNVMKDLSP